MTVTCIVPVFNGERFLAEALRSVLEQEGPGVEELVVVDDGSTDGTLDVLADFGDAVRVVSTPHAGVAAARNRGLAEARGDLIAFQDADDVWMPGKLAAQRAAFDADPALDLCLGHVENFWMPEVGAEEDAYRGSRFAGTVPGFLLQAMLARRTAFDRVGLFDPALRVASDNDWFLRARDGGMAVRVLDQVVVHRRLHAHNLTRTDLASREALLRNMKASLERRRAARDD